MPALVAQDGLTVLVGKHGIGKGSPGDPGLRCHFCQDGPVFLRVSEVKVDAWNIEFLHGSSHERNLHHQLALGTGQDGQVSLY